MKEMNIVLTGSLGHINQPLAGILLQQGHALTIISSNAARKTAIEALGAKAAIGSLTDPAFLTETFNAADIVYLMEPPMNFRDASTDMDTSWTNIARAYAKAIEQSGVKQVIHLSSIGAHTDKGNGILRAHFYVENILKELPENVSIKFMRPVGFYYNMFAFIPVIKQQHAIIQNYGGSEKEPWVSVLDIAAAIAYEAGQPFNGRSVHYIVSDEVSPDEVAAALGKAIGKPELQWKSIADEDFLNNLLSAGFTMEAAKGVTGMNAGRRHDLYDDYNRNKPAVFGKIKLDDFAKDFAAAYHQQ